MSDSTERILIKHNKLIDGAPELKNYSFYRPFETFCGICDAPFTLSPRVQKYMLEVKSIPVKMLQLGAVYCVPCRRRRSRIKWLKRGDKWRTEPTFKEELSQLLDEEKKLTLRSKARYRYAVSPYRSPIVRFIERIIRRLSRHSEAIRFRNEE